MQNCNEKYIARYFPVAAIVGVLLSGVCSADGWDPTTKASNRDSILNTRHNLTQSYIPGGGSGFMDYARNDYGEVCVYCHTPHGASDQITAPLWNRTQKSNVYTLYKIPLSSGQAPQQPGSASVTCLSCHDGTTAIDSIINMPGGGNYLASQEVSQDDAFLDTWTNPSGIAVIDHGVISSPASGYFTGPYNCNRCHTAGNVWGIPDFAPFNIGLDLTNDHPVGVTLPDHSQNDFRQAFGLQTGKTQFYDENGNGKADTNEVRLYYNGTDYRVECATCHDPHGVAPSAGAEMYPSFLRKSNSASALCLTCHVK